MRRLPLWTVGSLVVMTVACAAMATDRYYPNRSAISPDGRYRVDAKSPENPAEGWGRPFAANFVYTLTDTRTGKAVWTRPQPMQRTKGDSRGYAAEGSPMAVFVDNTGLVAAHVAGEALVLLSASTGQKHGEIDLLRSFPAAQQDRHVMNTTAGPMWTQNSRWAFLRIPGDGDRSDTLLFVVRPFWGHRLVIDANRARLIDLGEWAASRVDSDLASAQPEVARIMRAVLTAERSAAAEELERATKDTAAFDALFTQQGAGQQWRVITAAHLAGQLRVTEAIPSLRKLEASLAGRVVADRRGWATAVEELLGPVRLALRRLGEIPQPGFGVQLHIMKQTEFSVSADADAPPLKLWVSVQERVTNAPKVNSGMTVKELADLIGSPDARAVEGASADLAYDYDIDADPPYTLRVRINPPANTIRSVQRITPPVWQDPTARESSPW